ncbi:MAG: hypothetical protein ACTSSH_02100 [Candidatus Heimdallarchaeota archaeon]
MRKLVLFTICLLIISGTSLTVIGSPFEARTKDYNSNLVDYLNQVINFASKDPVDWSFNLSAMTNYDLGSIRPEYLRYLQEDLAEIGIGIDLDLVDWPTFVGELIAYYGFDMCYIDLTAKVLDPDMTGIYDQDGSLNFFGYDTTMDYEPGLGTGRNEWYLEQGKLIMPPDSEARIQHYWDWQQYLMDDILPHVPGFTPKSFDASWDNLNGYNMTDGILQSFGKMSWSGTHVGQISTSEIVMTTQNWTDLNPLFQKDSDSFLSSLILDPLLWEDTDLSVWPHLAESYTYLNATTIEISIREDIKWQTDPDGLFTDEYLDIEDVYFTLYSWKHVSNDQHLWMWIEDMEIIDDMTMKIYIDGDDSTPENDPYAQSLHELSTLILPEHYLNQTQMGDGVTPNVTHSSWAKFANETFGTGLFELNSRTVGVETELTTFSDS